MNIFHTNFFISKPNEDYENTSLLLNFVSEKQVTEDSLSKLSGDRFEDMVIMDWPPPFEEDHANMLMLGSSSVNGIICLYQDYSDGTPIVLWNPATKETKVLPPSFQLYNGKIEFNPPPSAFGYDCVTHDYKVLRNVLFLPEDSPYAFSKGSWLFLPEKDSPLWELLMDDDHKFWSEEYIDPHPFWEIYSLKSNNWRKLNHIDTPLPFTTCRSLVNSNELCHFLEGGDKMFSFDFSNEKFIQTVLPSDSNFKYHSENQHLLILNESVAFTCYDCENNFHIWILGKLSVKESWTKVLTIGPGNDLSYSIIGAWKSHILLSVYPKIARYNLSTRNFEEFDFYIWKVIIYKEVLSSMERMKN
ncbi:uncharacterized protein LOC131633105 [Vicia villosa]|uniref:uncharacterized protein LOC131633105 n=1 Tax=Vicia villosa TaxID=3911 RepID=UPI00273C2F5D|nr:uncharacterized protein LOC131633105 [Vicia villosa]